MEIKPIFSIGIGIQECPEAVVFGKNLFEENKELFRDTKTNNFSTTLKSYWHPKNAPEYKDSESLYKIKELILKNVISYFEGCGYNPKNYEFMLNSFWLNEMGPGSFHKSHMHYGYQVSGCFYVDVPVNSGPIEFTSPFGNAPLGGFGVKEHTPYTSDTWVLVPKPGDIFIWRSDLFHGVPRTNFEGVRRSIAFDVRALQTN